MLGETCRCNGVARLAVGPNLRCIRLGISQNISEHLSTPKDSKRLELVLHISLLSFRMFQMFEESWCFISGRRISGDHSTPKIVQGADNGTLAGALGYAAWQLHDGVWWLFLMVIPKCAAVEAVEDWSPEAVSSVRAVATATNCLEGIFKAAGINLGWGTSPCLAISCNVLQQTRLTVSYMPLM